MHAACVCVWKLNFSRHFHLREVEKSPREAAAASEDSPGGCGRLIKVGRVLDREVTCARGPRMPELKDCNYGLMGEFDWIRAVAPG